MTSTSFTTITAPTEYLTLIRARPKVRVMTHIQTSHVGDRATSACGKTFNVNNPDVLCDNPADRAALDCWDCCRAQGISLI